MACGNIFKLNYDLFLMEFIASESGNKAWLIATWFVVEKKSDMKTVVMRFKIKCVTLILADTEVLYQGSQLHTPLQ